MRSAIFPDGQAPPRTAAFSISDWPVLIFPGLVPSAGTNTGAVPGGRGDSAALVISVQAGGALAHSMTSAALRRFNF